MPRISEPIADRRAHRRGPGGTTPLAGRHPPRADGAVAPTPVSWPMPAHPDQTATVAGKARTSSGHDRTVWARPGRSEGRSSLAAGGRVVQPGGAGLPCRPLTAQWGRPAAGAPQAPGGPDAAPVKSASSAGTRRGLMTGGPSPGWVSWMAEALASSRGRWWDMMLLLDQLGGIWEIATGANSPQPGPAGLKRSF